MKKEDIVCFVSGVVGHKANHCRNRKGKGPSPGQHKGRKAEVNVALTSSSSEGYVPQAFMANPSIDWWIDTCATRHICADQSCFSSF